jgi:hypothetical protein
MFPKVEEFIQLAGAIKLNLEHQKKFKYWVDYQRQRLVSKVEDDGVLAVWGRWECCIVSIYVPLNWQKLNF